MMIMKNKIQLLYRQWQAEHPEIKDPSEIFDAGFWAAIAWLELEDK
jgi:hypothetical protein